jgi:hypothetical protein
VNKEENETIEFEENSLSICMTKLQDDSNEMYASTYVGNVFDEDDKTTTLGENLDQSIKDYENYDDSCILSSISLIMCDYDIHNEVLEVEIVNLENSKFDEDASLIK